MWEIMKFEWYKMFQKKILWVTMAAILLLNILIVSGWGAPSAIVTLKTSEVLTGLQAVKADKEFTKPYEGKLTDEKVQQILSDFEFYVKDLSSSSFWGHNFVYKTIVRNFAGRDGDIKSVKDVFPAVSDSIYLQYNEGWINFIYFMSNIILFVGIAIVITISPVYSEEYMKGMDSLILTSKYGKTAFTKAKFLACFLFSFIFVLLILGINLIIQFATYGTTGLESSVQLNSLLIFSNVPYLLTCGQALIYAIFLWIFSMLIVTVTTLIISALCNSSFVTLIIAFTLYIYPLFLSPKTTMSQFLVSLNPAGNIDIMSPLSLPKLSFFNISFSYTWVIGILCILCTIFVFIFGRKIFAKHQVK